MTFYNIIFGLLFIGAFREVIFALANLDWPLFFLATTLSVLVFSDTIYTTDIIDVDGKNNLYSVDLKLLDLLSFILLSFAVVVLNPVSNDMFEVDVTPVLDTIAGKSGLNKETLLETLFWGLLTLYMLILVRWNKLLGLDRVKLRHRWVNKVQPGFVLVFAVMAGLAWFSVEPELHCARWIVCLFVVVYLLGFKRYVCIKKLHDQLDVVTLEELTEDDVAAIREWPRYQGKIELLDYALRRGGWLDHYPASETNKRYAIRERKSGKLVGFSLLTDIKDRQAELYIALRADEIKKGFGRAGVEETIRRGFNELGLKEIHLKVRDWHDEARKLYERVGFRKCGESVEIIQGQDVNFVLMKIFRPWFS